MVGGASRMPIILEGMQKVFTASKLLYTLSPDKIVAMGAALQANNLIKNNSKYSKAILLDVVPLSIGIELMGGIVQKIIEKNSTIPITKKQEFTTYKDSQTAIKFHIIQGEREQAKDCRSLATFSLKNIPPMVAGTAKVEVIFSIDVNGLLTVSAREKSTNQKTQIEVKPSYGLKEDDIEKILKESILFAREDIEKKLLIEQQVLAKKIIDVLNSALEKSKYLLDDKEITQIEKAKKNLSDVLFSNDKDKIKDMIKKLEKVSDNFAMKRMNSSMENFMKGKHISKF